MQRSEDWLRQAERDLLKVRLDLENEFFEWACFTAHQAAEKALKAVYQARSLSVRGHAVLSLLHGLGEEISEPLLHAARVLDRYYIEARYPNGLIDGAPMDYFDRQLAEEALDVAQAVVRFCRDRLG